MNIAFVLLTYNPDEPAGMERSLAALVRGLAGLGHRVFVLTAGPPGPTDGPELVRLALRLPRPAVEDQLIAAVRAAPHLANQMRSVLRDLDADLVCWVDAAWGLGYLAPAPPGVATVLMVRVLRTDELIHRALAHRPGRVLTNSDFLIHQASQAGLDTTEWRVVPNALLHGADTPSPAERERLRRQGPVRLVARLEPQKGIPALLRACPAHLDRDVEVVLAEAGFEYWTGMQREVLADCREAAAAHSRLGLLRALGWREVQPFLAGACCTVVASTAPETFCNVALEAMSVGTPVVSFDLGHVPALIGEAGVCVPLSAGPAGLWTAIEELVASPVPYLYASRAGRARAARYSPEAAARAFLEAAKAP